MNILIITTGKCKEKEINNQVDTFIKRLKPYFPTKLIEVPQVKGNSADEIKQKEAALQSAKIPDNAYIIIMDEHGDMVTSRKFAGKLEALKNNGTRNIVFIIGGAEGLHETVKQKANWQLSLSPLTFAHMMVRPILTEQIYRAAMILNNHPYHRD